MTHTQKRGLCWLIAAVMTAALMLFVLLFTDVIYAVNDDPTILRAFLGYETGEPARFHIYIHGLLAWPLCWISNLLPGLPWFTYLQLALLALSCVVIAKSIMQSFLKYRGSLLAGALMAAVFLLVLCMKYISRLTYTQTAALLGAAAVSQLFSVVHDQGDRRVITGLAGSLVLVCLSYALRQNTLLPVTAVCALVFLLTFWEHYGFGKAAKRSAKPMIISLTMIVLVLGGMLGVRQLELNQPDVHPYFAYDESRREITDYIGISNIGQEACELAGWDEETLAMAKKWCFLDPDFSTNALSTLAEYAHAHDTRTILDRLKESARLILHTAAQHALDIRCMGVAAIAALVCLCAACFKRNLRLVLSVLGSLGLAAAMIGYLAFAGRLPLRALLIAALPCAAVCFNLLPACLPGKKKMISAVCYLFIAAVGLSCLSPILADQNAVQQTSNPLRELEEYALSEPQSLFLFDLTLTDADLDAFPDYREGIPHNISSWGGWELRSPESIRQFANFGIDLNNFTPQNLLRDHVHIASLSSTPPSVLLDWLHSEVDSEIDCQLYAEYGDVHIFHFYETEIQP